MRAMKFAAMLLVACVLNACSPSTEGDEAAIRAANKAWMEAIVAKDAKAIAAIYAEDGQFLPPNGPKAVGREAVEKNWAGAVARPGMTLTFETEKFVFSKSGDLAVDIGTYKFAAGGQNDTGKSVVTWTKRDGKWLVLTDMYSSDLPPPPPAVAAPAPTETPTPTTPPAQ